MFEERIGTVHDFFAHPVVAGIELNKCIKVGDRIKIKGRTTDLECLIESMQINHHAVRDAIAGDSIGIKVPVRVRRGDKVYRIAV